MKQHPQPPRWASRFLHWFCKPEELDILEGDLLELFDKRLEQGKQHARLHYVRDVFSLFRPFAIKNLHLPLVYLDMFQHNVKISFRNILRNRTHSLINLAGLSVGMVCATILFMKVNYELSFDNFQQDSDRIFRILVKNDLQGLTNSGVPHPLGEAIRTDYPNFERVTMVEGMYDVLVEIVDQPGQRFLEEKGIAYVEPDYFRMFSFNWKEGNPDNVIDQPYTAVISESLAKKYFGKQDPMGQLLRLDNRFEVKINGIIEDQPQNTELPSGLLVTYHLGKEHQRDVQDNWGSVSSSVQCFVKLPVGLSHESIEGESPEFLAKYKDLDEGETERMILMPLREIHFFTEGDHWGTAPMEKSSLWALGLIGLFLLIAACINFINLNTVLVFKRAKEVGLRKVLGSMPRQIVGYFLNETALITLFSLVLCIIFVSPIQEFLTYYLGDGGEIDFANPSLWLFWGAAFLGVLLLAGLYPAFRLSGLNPVLSLKNKIDRKYGKGLNLRRSLVVVQFAISQALIIITLLMMQQMEYFRNQPLGFDQNAIYEFGNPIQNSQEAERLKTALKQIPAISQVSLSSAGAASGSIWKSNFYFFSPEQEEPLEDFSQVKLIDVDYLETYGIPLLAGENVIPTDTVNRYLINEKMMRLLGYENPADILGMELKTWGRRAPISGVIQDFHMNTLHKAIDPLILFVEPESFYTCGVKLNETSPKVLGQIEQTWSEIFPTYYFSGRFLDRTIEDFYESEQKAFELFEIFSLIAIFIGAIGLFGLISFVVAQRTKEIGIRKVLGANLQQIIMLLNREFFVLVLMGFVLAAPLAWFFIDQWLAEFAFKIEPGVMAFGIALVASLVLVLLIVGSRTLRVAMTNPVTSLRDE